jgi:hypothetical protein
MSVVVVHGGCMSDLWLWDERGDLAYRLGKLRKPDLDKYLEIQRLRKVAICYQCGEKAIHRYAPVDCKEQTEFERWRCERHAPLEAVSWKHWNGEWNTFPDI